jgi:putative methyltransferase (TIGR04325 family)
MEPPFLAGISAVLDFGGGAGLHYKAVQRQNPDIRWAVVETPAMVARASELATERLSFFTELYAAVQWLGQLDLVYSNGALQYTPDPLSTLRAICALRAPTILWDRAMLSDRDLEREVQLSYLNDNGPQGPTAQKEKIVKYVMTKIPRSDFLAAHGDYDLLSSTETRFLFTLRR